MGQAGNALVAQGIEHRFPNPKFHVAKNGKRWKIRLFAGFRWYKTHPYCRTLERASSSSGAMKTKEST